MPLMVGGRRVDRRLARHPPPSPTISIAVTITCTVSQLLCCVHFAPTVCLLIRYFTLYRRSIESRAAAGLPVRPLGWLNQSARREMTLGQLPARATFTFLIHSLVFQLFTRFSFLISLVLLFPPHAGRSSHFDSHHQVNSKVNFIAVRLCRSPFSATLSTAICSRCPAAVGSRNFESLLYLVTSASFECVFYEPHADSAPCNVSSQLSTLSVLSTEHLPIGIFVVLPTGLLYHAHKLHLWPDLLAKRGALMKSHCCIE